MCFGSQFFSITGAANCGYLASYSLGWRRKLIKCILYYCCEVMDITVPASSIIRRRCGKYDQIEYGAVKEWKNKAVEGSRRQGYSWLMSCTEQTAFLMTLCLSRFSNKQHSLWLIRKEWPPHRPYTDPRRLAHQPISPFISPECLLCVLRSPGASCAWSKPTRKDRC